MSTSPSPRAEMPEISIDERRGSYTEVETGFPEDVAVREALRCLGCRRCLGCALCWAECKPEAIDFGIPDEEVNLEFDEVILTKGQDNAFQSFSDSLGYDTYANVITDLQFERMLSPTGLTKGLVVSPHDGDIPGRIAIVQGHPEGDEAYLVSSLILGVNEAILALKTTNDLEVLLVSPLCDSFREKFRAEAEKINGLTIIDGLPESVEKAGNDASLTLSYSENSGQKKESFDLIVVLTNPKISDEIQSLSKKLEQEIV